MAKAGAESRPLAIANCLVKLGQISSAKEMFFKALSKNPSSPDNLLLANEICSHLNKSDSMQFWQRLHHSGFGHQDEVLWNLAIRTSLPQAINYYQEILTHYPDSNHAPQAQWWIFWQKVKLNQNQSQLASLSAAAANKYSHSKLASRFLFWTGKIFEAMLDRQRASFYYQQTTKLFPYDYYGLRAYIRYLALQNLPVDNCFKTQEPLLVSQEWDWPVPESAINQLKNEEQDCAFELIYLKQYAEALAQDQSNNYKPVLVSWLNGKIGQPLLAINIAFKALKEESSQSPEKSLLRYYSYPLLYHQEIVNDCNKNPFVDPWLIHALVREESRYNRNAISPAKALGLCQLMPATASGVAKSLGLTCNGAQDLFQADLNLKLGITHLSSLLAAFRGDKLLAIASYNAGVNAVKNQLANKNNGLYDYPDQFLEDFPYRETRDYIRNVLASYWSYQQLYKRN